MCADWNYSHAHAEVPMNPWILAGAYDHHLVPGFESSQVAYVEEDHESVYKTGGALKAEGVYKNEMFNNVFSFNRPLQVPRTSSIDSDFSHNTHLSVESYNSPTPSLFPDVTDAASNATSLSPVVPAQHPTAIILKSSPKTIAQKMSPPPKKAPKRRGRPRLRSPDSDDDISSANSKQRRKRLPHNQVERKYRQGLNAELERLRKTIPTLPQRSPGDAHAPPKPSKATVLASAISYIQAVESERDKLAKEIESLRAASNAERVGRPGSCLTCEHSGMQAAS